MEAPSSGGWSELPVDIFRCVLEHLSFLDFYRVKMVCSNWYLCSKQTLLPKFRSPLVMLCSEEGGPRLYSAEVDRVYKTTSDLSGYQFLGNSGKWFLVVDSKSDLYIVDVFSDERILLPRLETLKGSHHEIQRVGENGFKENLIKRGNIFAWDHRTSKDLTGLVWVDDKSGDYVVVWRVSTCQYLGFCKKGDLHYSEITTHLDVCRDLQGVFDLALKGYNLYILSTRKYIRHLDLSGPDGVVKDVSVYHKFPMWMPIADERAFNAYKPISVGRSIVLPTSSREEPLFLYTRAYEPTSGRPRIFRLYKRDAKDLDPGTLDSWLVEVNSLGDEALFFDMGITVPADRTLGIEPNSIYFTRNDSRITLTKGSSPCIDVCVYNLATKTFKPFASLSNIKLNDAMWFLPS